MEATSTLGSNKLSIGDVVSYNCIEGFGGLASIIETREDPFSNYKIKPINICHSAFWAHNFEIESVGKPTLFQHVRLQDIQPLGALSDVFRFSFKDNITNETYFEIELFSNNSKEAISHVMQSLVSNNLHLIKIEKSLIVFVDVKNNNLQQVNNADTKEYYIVYVQKELCVPLEDIPF